MHTSGNLDDPLEHAFTSGNSDSAQSTNKEHKGSIRGWVGPIRDASRSVKSVISGAMQDFKSHQEESMTTINEEVQVIEFAPAIFKCIKDMDGITESMIQESLSTDSNTQ